MPITSFGEAVAIHARRTPQAAALSGDGTVVTWQELEERTNRRARWFLALGVDAGDLVSVVMRNSIEYFETCIAIWKVGATPQPISPQLSERERDEILALGEPSLVVGPATAGAGRSVLSAGAPIPEGMSSAPLPNRLVSPSWKAPTSGGSTGRPKIVIATDPALIDPHEGLRALGMRAGAKQLVVAPLYHNAPFVASMRGLLSGGHVVVRDRFDPAATLKDLQELAINWVMLVPTMMHRIMRLDPTTRDSDLPMLEAVFHVGGPCAPWLKQAWIDWLGPERIYELYGGTEQQATTVITGTEWLEHPGSVGCPGRHSYGSEESTKEADGRIEVRDADNKVVDCGQIGEIWMHTNPARPTYRYLGAEPRRVGDWESIGDMGWLDADGYLYIADRRLDMIVTGGANVYPAEVEGQILEHPRVEGCVVIGLPDDDLGRRVHALVQMDAEVGLDELRAFLADRLARYKIPRTFERLEEIPRDEAGKIRRSALVEARAGDGSSGLQKWPL
jgi:bile acid-coenzyme A ligase